jgi:hypothetical protein
VVRQGIGGCWMKFLLNVMLMLSQINQIRVKKVIVTCILGGKRMNSDADYVATVRIS